MWNHHQWMLAKQKLPWYYNKRLDIGHTSTLTGFFFLSLFAIFTPMSLFLAGLFSQSLCCHPTGQCNTEAGFSYLYHLSTHIKCIIQAEYQASTDGGRHKQSFWLFLTFLNSFLLLFMSFWREIWPQRQLKLQHITSQVYQGILSSHKRLGWL